MKYETLIKRAMSKEIKKQLKKDRDLNRIMRALDIQFPSTDKVTKWEMIERTI
jgi:superfamily II helicase